jgi:WD40 repeat protein
VNAVAFSQDGSLLASGSRDQTVRLWNPMTGQEAQKLEGHTDWVTAVAFSQDGSLLASGSWDQTVRLWNPTTGQEAQKLEGHADSVTAVAFSQDGSLLASGSWDHTVRLWNPTTGQEAQKLEGHADSVTAVAFSQDGSLLASGSWDHTVRLWNPTTGQEVQKVNYVQVIRTISLTTDNKTLLTDQGAISINDGSMTDLALEFLTNITVTIKDDWIQRGDYNLLWLPHEYRSDYSAFYGDTFAIGRHSGQVSFIGLDHS